MKPPESLSARIHRNLCENTNWLYDLWYDDEEKRDKLQRYYQWHFKELVLCVILAVLLTRVDKVQQFFSAFATDIKNGVQLPLQFVVVFGLNGVVIFWLCYVFWHKPMRFQAGHWRRWICGDKRREDFEAYYRKPGNAWRVAMVSNLPMLLVSATLSLALLRDNPLDNKTSSPLSFWLESNAMPVLFGLAVLYLIAGSLIRPRSYVCDSRSARRHQREQDHPGATHSAAKPPKHFRRLEKIFRCEQCLKESRDEERHLEDCPKTATEYDAQLGMLWKAYRKNFRLLLVSMTVLGILVWFYRFYAAPFCYFALLVFSLWGPLAVAFFLNSFSECLIVEAQKKDACEKEDKTYEPKFETWYDWLMRASYFAGIAIFLTCNNKSITSQEWFSLWMFPIAMLMFVFIAYYQVLDLLSYNMTTLRFYALIGAVLVLLVFFAQRDHYRMKFNGEAPRSGSLQRASLEAYFLQWAKDRFQKDTSGFEVYLVAAEGGGSRSGAWTGAVLTQLDSVSDGRFRRQCFAMSAVSGGAFGTAATLALWDHAQQSGIGDAAVYRNGCRVNYLGRVFKRNYISTALAGVFFYDLLQQIPGVHLLYRGQHSRTDRHQDEEDNAVCAGLGDIFGEKRRLQHNYFKKTNFLALYYTNEWGDSVARPKTDLPLYFPNTCRVEDGRRGIVSPVLMNGAQAKVNPENPFNDAAVDIIGIARDKEPAKALSIGEATSLSELFPYVNSTVFINENTGSFMDGGAYENLGLTTLYEIRVALEKICGNPDAAWLGQMLPDSSRPVFVDYLKKLQFKMLLIYNFDNHENKTRAYYEGNSLQLLDPITAMMQTPFGGHTDYMYHKVKSELGAQEVIDFPLLTSKEPRSTRSDKIVMSRWLSKYEMNEIMKRAAVCVDSNLCRVNGRWCGESGIKPF
ncbi:MAG: hypothetical protein DYG98_10390 [Haliscomenobacteraceae bacterium CHB4]|nr:hypothetical protein [Haliscomenobacteraceae bacterium CHB4]